MLRVAFDVHAIGQEATGNETYAEGLMRAYEAAPPDGMEMTFYHTGAFGPEARTGQLRRLFPAWPYLRIPVVTPWRLARDRIDVAHFQYFAPPLSPCPVVLTVHDLSYEKHPEFFSPAMASRMRRVMPRMVRMARHLIAVSKATRDDLVSVYGLDPGRISVIHNGLGAGFGKLDDAPRAMRMTARFAINRPFILCVGNLGARKNQRQLVRAYARLARATPHDLVLVGKQAWGGDRVVEEIRALGIGDRVHMTGFVTQEELLGLYNRATFSVYPSFYEGFGLPVLESMACGTPVITSVVSSMPEIAGDAALLVDPADEDALGAAMARLLGSAELCVRLREAGLARSRQFSWADAAARTVEVYRRAARR